MKIVRAGIGAVAVWCVGCVGEVDTDSTVLALTNVPASVQCLRFRVTSPGATAVVIDRTVTAGTEALVDLGALPDGPTQLSAEAFPTACASVGPTDSAAWVAPPVTVTLRAGYVNSVDLTFRPATMVSVRGDFVVPARSIGAGGRAFYAVMQDGTVRAWGSNSSFQLGSSTGTQSSRPVTVPGLSDVTQVVGGDGHACALRRDGTALCWGANNTGQLGNGTTVYTSTPTAVTQGAVRYAQLTAGLVHTCALSTDPAVSPGLHCWGNRNANQYGAIGPDQLTPLYANSGSFGEVRAGMQHSCARSASGRVLCVGQNGSGQLGIGTTLTATGWTLASAYGLVQALAAGATHTCVIDLVGGVRCAGSNSYGELGVGTTTAATSPLPVAITNVTQLALGSNFTCALRGDGTVSCWGRSDLGSVGVPALAGSIVSTPQPVAGLSDVTGIAAGIDTACAVKRDGTVWCWGGNGAGQAGDGSNLARFSPVRVLF